MNIICFGNKLKIKNVVQGAIMKEVMNKNGYELEEKIIVLDDDPTGIQTVHDVYVYADWSVDTLRQAFRDEKQMFFILTNSRSFSQSETRRVHEEIGRNIQCVSEEVGKKFLIISRGDSTLRGHYPLETQVLCETLEKKEAPYDGEIICPFFCEGDRITIHGTHYIKNKDKQIPVNKTEFAKDATFGYNHAHLGNFVEEKTEGRFRAKDCVYIDIEQLQNGDVNEIYTRLLSVDGFNKVIVDSTNYKELKVFAQGLIKAIQSGKKFIIRSAASLPKVLGNIEEQPFLSKENVCLEQGRGGVVLIGSHVQKTTKQLEYLARAHVKADFIEFEINKVKIHGALERHVKDIVNILEKNIQEGTTTVIYTSRKLLDLQTQDKEKILAASVKISQSLVSIIGLLTLKPGFILAKGGITSSDVGTKALQVKKAFVLGQIKPGIPVWLTGEESKFPNTPYIIFPGNVGEVETLKEIVELLS